MPTLWMYLDTGKSELHISATQSVPMKFKNGTPNPYLTIFILQVFNSFGFLILRGQIIQSSNLALWASILNCIYVICVLLRARCLVLPSLSIKNKLQTKIPDSNYFLLLVGNSTCRYLCSSLSCQCSHLSPFVCTCYACLKFSIFCVIFFWNITQKLKKIKVFNMNTFNLLEVRFSSD